MLLKKDDFKPEVTHCLHLVGFVWSASDLAFLAQVVSTSKN